MKSLKNTIRWYFTRDALPFWGMIILDSIFVIVSGLLAFLLHHWHEPMSGVFWPLLRTLLIFLPCFWVSFKIFHTYVGVIKFSSFNDLVSIFQSVLVAMALVVILQESLRGTRLILHFGGANMVLFGLLVVTFMVLTRIWVKTLYEEYLHRNIQQKAYILGVRSGAVSLAKNINTSATSQYRLAGFITNEPNMVHHMLMGKEIFLFDRSLIDKMLRRKVHYIIVSPLMMSALHEYSELTGEFVDAGIKFLVLPNATEWDGKSDIQVANLKPVDVEDLLPREKIEVDMKAAAELLTGHVVMITGAAGSIGSEMVRQIATYDPKILVLVDQAETPMHDIRLMMSKEYPNLRAETIVADISDRRMMERLFNRYRPGYVFHAAAYKHVPMMENNPYESVVNNILGTKIIADLAVKYGTRKFVMVSTDKAVNPTNVMGCSKRICEIYVQSLDKAIKDGEVKGVTQFVTTRFGNVLGSNGSVIPLFQKQIQSGGPLTVTHPDIIRYFMLIPEACKLVIEAGTIGKGGEIFVFDMGEPVRIADLAKRMIQLSGAVNVDIIYTGLRDGEKLYEEVLNDKEITLPTFHPKIKIAKVREYDFDAVSRKIDDLIDTSADIDDMQIVAKMKAIVPEYKSANSKYSSLDQ
ncbi:MAG: polysaccharide biosynthesis protein [Muribaculaceae bacterium]|nr:polysaccharide biosynthesis protein [Muribaculaceae bacterium]